MNKKWRGFTLIEVSLFLAITALIFVGVMLGTQNSIFQQRYNDAVQTFADFLRNNYSQTTNVQSDGTGTSDKLIYGRLISFGNDDNDKVVSYSVIGGGVDPSLSGNVIELLASGSVNAMVGKIEKEGQLIGLTETYVPKWGSKIQVKNENSDEFSTFNGAILIVRHPETGSVYTYVTRNSVNEGKLIKEINFNQDQLDLCVNPNGDADSDLRKDVRIVANAKNASGVVLVPDDNSECK